jgi:hypothetical protein
MFTPVRSGILLGVLVTIWQFVMGLTGWYKDPALMNVFFLVIVFEIVVLLRMLWQTAPTAAYVGQLVNGLVFSLVAGAIIVCGSLIFTTVAYPDYFKEMQAMQAGILKAQGLSEADIQAQLAAAAATQTPLMNALSGVIGTVATGVVVSAVAGIWLRRK